MPPQGGVSDHAGLWLCQCGLSGCTWQSTTPNDHAVIQHSRSLMIMMLRVH